MQDCGPGFVPAELVQIWCNFASVGAASFVEGAGLCGQEQQINHCVGIQS